MADVRIKRVVSWTIPYFGNDHIMPYGEFEVTDGTTTKYCKTKGDRLYDNCDYQYITFNRKRYKVVHLPNNRLTLKEIEK